DPQSDSDACHEDRLSDVVDRSGMAIIPAIPANGVGLSPCGRRRNLRSDATDRGSNPSNLPSASTAAGRGASCRPLFLSGDIRGGDGGGGTRHTRTTTPSEVDTWIDCSGRVGNRAAWDGQWAGP